MDYISFVTTDQEHMAACSFSTLIASVLFCIYGCGSSPGLVEMSSGASIDTLRSAKRDGLEGKLYLPDRRDLTGEERKDLAIRHYIAGSVHEGNGEHDSAIAAYSRALAYDPSPVIHAALAREYLQNEQIQEAGFHAREAVALAPENVQMREQLADVHLAAGEQDSAVAEFEIILRLDSTNEQTRYTLARLNHERNPQRALQLYESLLEGTADDEDLLVHIAEIHTASGDYGKAVSALETIWRHDPGNEYALNSLVDNYLQLNRIDDAIAILQELQRRFPEQQEYPMRLAEMYIELDQWQEAGSILRGMLAGDSLDTGMAMRIGELYFQQAVFDTSIVSEAQDAFAALKRRVPDDWHAWWYAGAISFNAGRMQDAAAQVHMVLERDPDNTQALDLLARACLSMDDFAAAIKPLRTLADKRAATPEQYAFLGFAYHQLRRDSSAVDALRLCLSLEPDRIDALTTLAMIHEGQKQYERSDSLYEHALRRYGDPSMQKDPACFLLLNNYAYSLSERGLSLERALSMSRQAFAFDSTNSSYVDTFGWVNFRLGKLDIAREYVLKAIELSQREQGSVGAELLEHMGDIALESGDRETAVSYWKKSQALDPANETLEQKIRAATP